jgi:hypothetical protein
MRSPPKEIKKMSLTLMSQWRTWPGTAPPGEVFTLRSYSILLHTPRKPHDNHQPAIAAQHRDRLELMYRRKIKEKKSKLQEGIKLNIY